MNESNEFTAKELYYISLHKKPDAMLKRILTDWLLFVVGSVCLVTYSLWSGDVACGVAGYGVLLVRVLYMLSKYKESLATSGSVYRKYEAQLLAKSGGG